MIEIYIYIYYVTINNNKKKIQKLRKLHCRLLIFFRSMDYKNSLNSINDHKFLL
jgi:hypothetical protein